MRFLGRIAEKQTEAATLRLRLQVNSEKLDSSTQDCNEASSRRGLVPWKLNETKRVRHGAFGVCGVKLA
ncbi:hypothetical protein, partial [Geobacillus jurassicus]|uniref:hypothetical protein n=1 Tax=Geobacillus jurassicus TaxID=235932 RepID=UPI001C3F3BB7